MPADDAVPLYAAVRRRGWRYQPVWIVDRAGTAFGVCEVYLDENNRLEQWTEEPLMHAQGDDVESLSRDLVRMLVDVYRWKAVAFAELRVGMEFDRLIDPAKAEALAKMVEAMSHNMGEARTPGTNPSTPTEGEEPSRG